MNTNIKYPKESPGGRYAMLMHLAKLSGLSPRKVIVIENPNNLRRKTASKTKPKTVLKYPARDIQVVSEGNTFPYMGGPGDNIRYDRLHPELIVDKFLVTIDRTWDEFGVEIKPAGLYKDSLGDGWYQHITLYNINGDYFAPDMG